MPAPYTLRHLAPAAAAVLLCGALSACGGSDDQPLLIGAFLVEATVAPNPATTANNLQAVAVVGYTGSAEDSPQTLTMPVTVRRTTSGAASWSKDMVLTYSASGNGWAGTATITIPSGQPAGAQTYCVQVDPQANYRLVGTVSDEVCSTVQIVAL